MRNRSKQSSEPHQPFLKWNFAANAPSIQLYLLVFAGWAFTTGLNGVSRLPIIAEFCSEAARPTYIALMNMITAPFVLAGLMGGWIANKFGYDAVFVITAALALTAAIWLKLMVEEPRKINHKALPKKVKYSQRMKAANG